MTITTVANACTTVDWLVPPMRTGVGGRSSSVTAAGERVTIACASARSRRAQRGAPSLALIP